MFKGFTCLIHRSTLFCPSSIVIMEPVAKDYMEEDDIFELSALNEKRKKVTIFTDENIFPRNKWEQQINLSLIELKRHQSWESSDVFNF